MTGLIVVAGPTASGKSALALRLAEAERGVIINADSMQLYRDLRGLTARPAPEDQARAPHRLYGILDAADPASAGRWLQLAGAAIGEALAERRPAIVVGGTGLYLHALLHGLAPVPDIPPMFAAPPGRGSPRWVRRHFMPSSPGWIPRWPRACGRPIASGCCARTRSSSAPGARLQPGRPCRRCASLCRRAAAASLWCRRGLRCTSASTGACAP